MNQTQSPTTTSAPNLPVAPTFSRTSRLFLWVLTGFLCSLGPWTTRLVNASPSGASTWYVAEETDPEEDGSFEHPFDSIQEVIDLHAQNGHTIAVLPGTYSQLIDYHDKQLIIRSTNGPDATVLDIAPLVANFQQNWYPVFIDGGQGPETVFEGFTIAGSRYTPIGIRDSSPIIRGNIIRDNDVTTVVTFPGLLSIAGGGVGLANSSALLIENHIIGNCTDNGAFGSRGAGGVHINGESDGLADPQIVRCVIANNVSGPSGLGGGIYSRHSSLSLFHSIVSNNSANFGGGIYFDSLPIAAVSAGTTSPKKLFLDDNLFAFNQASFRGGALNLAVQDPMSFPGAESFIKSSTFSENSAPLGQAIRITVGPLPVDNCILWGNGPGAVSSVGTSSVVYRFCDVEGGAGGLGVFEALPDFVDPDGPDDDPGTWKDNDFRLQSGSPAIDAGHSGLRATDSADVDEDGDTFEAVPLDLDLRSRVIDGGISLQMDVGCYESDAPSTPWIQAVSPSQGDLNGSRCADILAVFSEPMDRMTIDGGSVLVRGSVSGPQAGGILPSVLNRLLRFRPSLGFDPGERVTMVLTNQIASSAGVPLSPGFSWSFTTAVTPSQGAFFRDDTHSVGDLPLDVVCADVDGDGARDLIVPNRNTNDVSVLLNDGQGGFPTREDYSAVLHPNAVAAADLDGDGDMDLAVSNWTVGILSIYLNDPSQGAGRFGDRLDFGCGSNPADIAVLDVDLDGDLDLAIPNWSADTLTILINDGSATSFTALISSTGDGPNAVSVGDLDRDGIQDLVTSHSYSNDVAVLTNDGSGVLGSPFFYPVGQIPEAVIVADLNGDERLDLATANKGSDDLSLLQNDGSGSFGPPVSISVGDLPVSLAALDLEGDGDLDLAVADLVSGDVYLLSNTGNLSFVFNGRVSVGQFPVQVLGADLDGDGDLDLVTADQLDDQVSILFNRTFKPILLH